MARDFTLREKDFAIRCLLNSFYSTIKKLEPLKEKDWNKHNEEYEKALKLYEQAFKVLATAEACKYGELFTVDEFRTDQKYRLFTPYDGSGVYLDWDGNKLDGVNWSKPYSAPDKAVFVAWYNK